MCVPACHLKCQFHLKCEILKSYFESKIIISMIYSEIRRDVMVVMVKEKRFTCCMACWAHLSSWGHNLCQLDGMLPGCSSHPISGISSCRDINTAGSLVKEKTLKLDQWAKAANLQRFLQGGDRPRYNLGLDVAHFSLGLSCFITNKFQDVTLKLKIRGGTFRIVEKLFLWGFPYFF